MIVSLIFYSWGEVRYFPIMLSIILVNYLAGLGIGRWRGHRKLCRGILAVSVVFSVGFLAFFKYSNFLLMNLNALFGTSFPMLEVTKNLPLGISFYTFQIMTYTIDVYFHKIEVEGLRSEGSDFCIFLASDSKREMLPAKTGKETAGC